MNNKIITDFVNAHKIVLFSASYCPWCRRAKDLLNARGAKYVVVELDNPKNNEIKPVLMEMTGRKTIPNIFIDGQNIGGYEDLVKHYQWLDGQPNTPVIVVEERRPRPIHRGMIRVDDRIGAPLWIRRPHLSNTRLLPGFRR